MALGPEHNEGNEPMFFAPATLEIVNGVARGKASMLGSDLVERKHLALALLEHMSKGDTPAKMGINVDTIVSVLIGHVTSYDPYAVMAEIGYDDDVADIIEESSKESTVHIVLPQHVMLSLLWKEKDDSVLGLSEHGLDYLRYKDSLLDDDGRQDLNTPRAI